MPLGQLPLLEFDGSVPALIEPDRVVSRGDVPAACVVTFFGDAVQRLLDEGATLIDENRWEDGPHPLIEVEFEGRRLAVLHAGVGGPLAVGLLEETIARGCRAFVACGGAGSLVAEQTVGHVVVLESALRDEGTSHHYVPASRWLDLDTASRSVLESTLTDHGVPFVTGSTWTTDAPYRETPAKIESRRSEGCLVVEMEAASLAAAARFRGVPFAQVVYCGDDLSGASWDHRSWQTRADVRDNLLRLASAAALRLKDDRQ